MRIPAIILLTCATIGASTLSAAVPTVRFSRAELPVLAGEEFNHAGHLTLVGDGSREHVTAIRYSFKGSDCLGHIESLSVYEADSRGRANRNRLIAVTDITSAEGEIRINYPLKSDTCHLAFTVEADRDIPLHGRVNLNCTGISTDSGAADLGTTYTEGLRVGIALRKARQDGVNTSRIPGLTTSAKGTLLAIYDARRDSGRDLQGDIDIALNRSEDGGRTWQPMQTVLDMKEWGGLPEKYNGVSDACILCDEKSGTIYVAGLWMHGVLDRDTGKWVEGLTRDSTRWIHQWHAKGSQPGLSEKETCQFLITSSTDDGLTWSEPVNITRMAKREEWWLYAPAPGHGITLDDGTLVFPSQGRDAEGQPFSNILYSKDGGKTWKASAPAYSNTTECMAVQTDNGDIMLNMRDNRNHGVASPNGRRICVTSDLGQTWHEHPTSHSVLTEPTCMASIHKHTYRARGGKRRTLLAFFNPDSYRSRSNLTLKLSFDNGMTWPEKYWLTLDEWGGAGYSCITSIDDDTLGIVYEGSGAQLVFQRIDLKELLGSR